MCGVRRRRVLGGRVARRLDELLGLIAAEHGWQIVAKEVSPIMCTCSFGSGRPMRQHRWCERLSFKGRTARVLRQEFPFLRNVAKVLWSPSYFAAPVGYVSETTVRRYIEHQWDAVLAS